MRLGLPSSERFIERKMLDARARELAEQAGVNWEELNNYPGYCKNVWREAAEALGIGAAKPRAQLH